MAEKKSFLMYKSWQPLVMAMKDEQAGQLLKAVFQYQSTGEMPDEGEAFYPMFNLFKSVFDDNQSKYERTCETNKRIAEEREKTKRHETSRSVTKRNGNSRSHTDTDTDTDTDTEKDTVTGIEKPQRTQAALVGESNLSDPVKEKLLEWLKYKKERREGYKETGLRTLISEVGRHEQESGSTAVINLINQSMSSGWKGIIWDRLPTARSGTSELDAWANA